MPTTAARLSCRFAVVGVQELLRQLEAVAQSSKSKELKPIPIQGKAILRVRFEKEQVHKTILVTGTTTTNDAIDMLIKKAARAPADQEKFRSWVLVLGDMGMRCKWHSIRYSLKALGVRVTNSLVVHHELGRVMDGDAPLLTAAGFQEGRDPPNLVFKPPTNIQARTIGEAFMQLVCCVALTPSYDEFMY
jgi:hypothetical protein